jgi:hypothetical protein
LTSQLSGGSLGAIMKLTTARTTTLFVFVLLIFLLRATIASAQT